MGWIGVWSIVFAALACAAGRQASRRKGRTPAWGFACLFFPPALLLLQMLPTYPGSATANASNLVLEWVGSAAALISTAILAAAIIAGHP
jgi:hypothetical protein